MHLAYNTNGLAHHDLKEGIRLLAEIGYRGVAVTLDHGTLSPYSDRTPAQLIDVAEILSGQRLRCVVETGGRFLLVLYCGLAIWINVAELRRRPAPPVPPSEAVVDIPAQAASNEVNTGLPEPPAGGPTGTPFAPFPL